MKILKIKRQAMNSILIRIRSSSVGRLYKPHRGFNAFRGLINASLWMRTRGFTSVSLLSYSTSHQSIWLKTTYFTNSFLLIPKTAGRSPLKSNNYNGTTCNKVLKCLCIPATISYSRNYSTKVPRQKLAYYKQVKICFCLITGKVHLRTLL